MATSTSAHPTNFFDLPPEILTVCFRFLDARPPSLHKSLSKPEYDLTSSSSQPLKTLSLTSTRTRSVVLPILFRHARLDPYHLSEFLAFVTRLGITRYVESVVARLQGPCNHIHPAWWSKLLDQLPNLCALTVLAAPHIFAEIGKVSIETSHSWAFKIPYQTISLGYASSSVTHSRPAAMTDDDLCFLCVEQSLLTKQTWTSLAVNESSHLPAYSTYEYFLKVPPSLLTSLYHRQHIQLQQQLQTRQSVEPYLSPSVAHFFGNLISFSYTAIFPFYNHVDEILKCVRQMTKLKRLFLKLCPEPESNILQDELERNGSNAGRTEGRFDVNDPWNEYVIFSIGASLRFILWQLVCVTLFPSFGRFETSYALIPHTIIYLTTDGCLEEFQTDDVKMIGVKSTLIEGIDRRLQELECWYHNGNGIWRRDTGVKS